MIKNGVEMDLEKLNGAPSGVSVQKARGLSTWPGVEQVGIIAEIMVGGVTRSSAVVVGVVRKKSEAARDGTREAVWIEYRLEGPHLQGCFQSVVVFML